VYIPKPDGRQRPLAVAALEDKIVQRAVVARYVGRGHAQRIGLQFERRLIGRERFAEIRAMVLLSR
jgi:hypothetical protein